MFDQETRTLKSHGSLFATSFLEVGILGDELAQQMEVLLKKPVSKCIVKKKIRN